MKVLLLPIVATLANGRFEAPEIDYGDLATLFVPVGGAVVVLLVALLRGRFVRNLLVPALATVTLLATIGASLAAWQAGPRAPTLAGSFKADALTLAVALISSVAGLVALALASAAPPRAAARARREAGPGEWAALLLIAIAGMVLLAGASSLVSLFVGIELLSLPLYVLCATELRRRRSLEAGLKYLVVGSVGSATLLFGLTLIYGATGATEFAAVADAVGRRVASGDALLLSGLGLVLAGLAFKASVAPFHQWTPDVYEGAPTPVTTFMSVATKAAALVVLARLLGEALPALEDVWMPALAALVVVSTLVGNVGALGQRSLKRMLGWSAIGQAGYMLVGLAAGGRVGVSALSFYLAAYALMNLAAFAIVSAYEGREGLADDLDTLRGLGRENPLSAWSMTIAMLALAGFPGTVGFVGKFTLIDAAVRGDRTWLGIVIVVGSMISLGYYLRVVATVWMSPAAAARPDLPAVVPAPVAGGSPEVDHRSPKLALIVAAALAALCVAAFAWPEPLFDLARDAGSALALPR